jgi:hypothetical protein
MIRKTIYAIAATAALAAVALPSAASAKHWGHHGHRGWGGFGLYIVDGGYSDCGWEYYRVGKRVYKYWTCG